MGEPLVVGIDIGSEFTSMFYGKGDEITCVSFPIEDLESLKASTQFYYKPKKGRDEMWFRYFKYLLLDKKDVPEHVTATTMYRRACAMQEMLNWDPIYMVAQFLIAVCKDKIPSEDHTISSNLLLVMTVPASWPSYVGHRLDKAAHVAGLMKSLEAKVEFITEPEAALLAIQDQPPIKWAQSGETVTICDMGAWTCDLTTYRVDHKHPLRLTQLSQTHSIQCREFVLEEEVTRLFEAKFSTPRTSWNPRGEYMVVPIDLDWDLSIKISRPEETKTWIINIRFQPWEVSRIDGSVKCKLENRERLVILRLLLGGIKNLANLHEDGLTKEHGKDMGWVIFIGGAVESPYVADLLSTIFHCSYIVESKLYEARTASGYGAVLHGLLLNHIDPLPTKKLELLLTYGFARDTKGGKVTKPKTLWDSTAGEWINADGACWALKKGTSNDMKRQAFRCEQIITDPNERPFTYFYTSPLKDPPRTKREGDLLCKLQWQRTFLRHLLREKKTELGHIYYTANYIVVLEACGDGLEVTFEAENTRIIGTYNISGAFGEEAVQEGAPQINVEMVVDVTEEPTATS